MSVNLTLAIMALVGILACLCAIICVALKRQPAMIWLGAGLLIGLVESAALKDANVTPMDALLTCVTISASYFCVAQAIRAAYGETSLPRAFVANVFVLNALSALLFALPAPPILQVLPVQVAAVACQCDMFRSVRANRAPRDRIDGAMMIVTGMLILVSVVRIPLFPILIDRPTPFPVIERDLLQTALVAAFTVLVPAIVFLVVARVVTNAIDAHRALAERDHLTGLPNRRGFEMLTRCAGSGGGTLVMCDIDRFKHVNDRFGHAAGDAVIRAFAQLLENAGCAARIGGEEFAIWMKGVPRDEALARAENLRREFASLRVIEMDRDHAVTASFGLAPMGPHTPLDLAYAQADAALYAAKNAGRDTVRSHGQEAAIETGCATLSISLAHSHRRQAA